MRNKEEIKSLLMQILAKVDAEKAQAEYYQHSSLATRFADNAITQNIAGSEEHLRLIVAYGNRHGSSITNIVDSTSVERLVQQAEDIARLSPEDPEYMPPLSPRDHPEVPQRYFEEVARLSPADLAEGIGGTVAAARREGYRASGLYSASCGIAALAGSEGLYAIDQSSSLSYSNTMHGPAGSGYCGASGNSLAQVTPAAVARQALETAVAAQNPTSIEPGEYTVVFEPQAVADLLDFLFFNMSARDADEGTTVFSKNIGERLFSEKINLETRIDDAELPAPAFGQDGLPSRHTVWVEKGIVKRLTHNRYWAGQSGTDPDPLLYPLFMEGEDHSLEELISRCERGLLVKRLWYIRYVDQRELLLTGMTRDGLFLIEGGKIAGPVQNLRFNESPVVFLKNVAALSRPQHVGSLKVPGILSEGFTFSSNTESV